MSDAITQVAHHVEKDFAVIFLKTADGEEHALTFGHHHTKAEDKAQHATKAAHHDHHGHDHHSQGKKQHADDVKHQHQHGHHDAGEHAVFNPRHYAVHLYSPLEKTQHNVTGVPRGWMGTRPRGEPLSPEGLHKLLKAEWYQEGVGCFVFESELTFAEHVLKLLLPPQ